MIPKNGTTLRAGSAALALLLILATALPAAGRMPETGQAPAGPDGSGADAVGHLTLKQAGREFLNDTGRIWSSPARIKGKHILPIFALAAATTFLIVSDESIRDGVQTYAAKHAWVGDVAPVITQAGGLAGFATAGVFFGAGLIFKDDRAKDTGIMAADAILQAFLVDNVLKGLTGRQRPFVAEGEDHWSGPATFFKRFEKAGSDLYGSFPSGHSAAAFSLATVVAMQYSRHAWVPVVAYTLAAGVGLSRMALDKHWASDVAIGAVLGHLIARLVVRNHGRPQRLVPALACTGRGLALSIFYDLDRDGR
jgi:membrane-associated phospholipid phosphatase